MNENFLHGIPTRLHFTVTKDAAGDWWQLQCKELPGIVTTVRVGSEYLFKFNVEDAIKEYLLAMITVTIEEEGKRDDHGDH